MGRRDRERREPGVDASYEGPDVLTGLLARAGSVFTAEDVASRFRHAQTHSAGRDVAIPALFPSEPRFASPEEARRLYANLFGLWQRVRVGLGAEDDTPLSGATTTAAAPPPEPERLPLPPRGAVSGRQVPPALVEAVWRHLDALPPRERQRLRDRFANAQPDVAAFVEALALQDVGSVAAQDLAFEVWAMLDHALGDRLGPASFADLRAFEAEPPPIETEQPAVATYVAEVLGLVAEEEPGFGPEAQAQVERAVATVVAAMDRAIGN
jgi:hypothetical protein